MYDPTLSNSPLIKQWRSVMNPSGTLIMAVSARGYIAGTSTSILCSDMSIRRTHTHDTISSAPLLLMSTLFPFIYIFLLEYLLPPKVGRDLRWSLKKAWVLLNDLFQGQLILLLVVELFKLAVSEARPHFWQYCAPDLTEDMCEKGYVTLTWENCTNPLDLPTTKLVDSMKSFPSGHAGLGAFIALYMILYTLHRFNLPWFKWLSITLCLLWFTWGTICGLSRMWDNRHHWWDVLTGAILGAIGALITIKCFSKNFQVLEMSRKNSVEPNSTNNHES